MHGCDSRGRLERLDDAWQAAVSGQRRAVLVSGEPDVGKTRLLAEFAGQVASQGAVVLYGRADADLGVPCQPIVQALTGCVRECPPQELAAQSGPRSGELVRLVPDLAEQVVDLAEPSVAEPEVGRSVSLGTLRR